MVFRQALPEERQLLFSEGYKEWRKNRSFEQYCTDNAKEDGYGTRYVLEIDGAIVSSLILLTLEDIAGKKAYGIGSVLTPKMYAGRGYASELITNCIKQHVHEDTYLFLFSDINPDFYRKFEFRILPPEFQKYEKSVCMVYCTNDNWCNLINCSPTELPDYF
jgi:predicted acetyltransferase